MTAATVTQSLQFIPGVKLGKISGANDYTTTFGLASVEGAVITTSSDEDAIVSVQISSGSATLGAQDDAGSAISTAFDMYFIAWGKE